MKKNNIARKAALCLASAAAFCTSAFAQFDASSKLTQMTNTVKTASTQAINLVSVLVGLIAVIMLAWNYFKRSKGDGQSNDALASWGWGLIIVIIGLQVVRVVFLQ